MLVFYAMALDPCTSICNYYARDQFRRGREGVKKLSVCKSDIFVEVLYVFAPVYVDTVHKLGPIFGSKIVPFFKILSFLFFARL